MKVAIVLASLLLMGVNHTFAECVARVYKQIHGHGPPLYKVLSCQNAEAYIRGSTDGAIWRKIAVKPDRFDLAIGLEPYNETAKSAYPKADVFWHYRGKCRSVPVGAVVQIESKGYCSDQGATKYTLLGDISIKEFIVPNETH